MDLKSRLMSLLWKIINMRPIPPKIRKILSQDPFMKTCIYDEEKYPDAPNHKCSGNLEWEHTAYYANRQINHVNLIMPCCTAHNHDGVMDKKYNQYVALSRLTEEQMTEIIKEYPRKNWRQELEFLTKFFTPVEKRIYTGHQLALI